MNEPLDDKEIDIMFDVMSWADAYEHDEKKRKKDRHLISEKQLKRKVRWAVKKLKDLESKKGKRKS